jgi:ubiquinone/menaquinone biosynthesis C-methylase UbiE
MTPDLSILNSMYVPADKLPDKIFEDNYIAARTREDRMYSDEEIARLPEIHPDHPHYKEWKIRKRSCEKLISYLKSKKKKLQILEVGCGNGWLSRELSAIPEARVVGMDINLTELKQAARVFHENSKLKFIYGNFLSGILKETSFNVIVFAAAVQYFKSLPELFNVCFKQLSQEGEIHVIDSPFYPAGEIDKAKERSNIYYQGLGLPELNNYYFHHSLSSLQPFNHQLLYDPASLRSRLFRRNHPFPWIQIKKD